MASDDELHDKYCVRGWGLYIINYIYRQEENHYLVRPNRMNVENVIACNEIAMDIGLSSGRVMLEHKLRISLPTKHKTNEVFPHFRLGVDIIEFKVYVNTCKYFGLDGRLEYMYLLNLQICEKTL